MKFCLFINFLIINLTSHLCGAKFTFQISMSINFSVVTRRVRNYVFQFTSQSKLFIYFDVCYAELSYCEKYKASTLHEASLSEKIACRFNYVIVSSNDGEIMRNVDVILSMSKGVKVNELLTLIKFLFVSKLTGKRLT